VWSTVRVNSILGVGPKVNDSIEDPFKYETWLESVHDGFRVRVIVTIVVSGYVSITFYVLTLSSE
jgi:hypothetical protein